MQLLNALPRQPFLGLSLAACAGIITADFAPNHSIGPLIVLTIIAIAALFSGNSLTVYAFVATGFYLLHSLTITDSPGLQLARELGADVHPATVSGRVLNEPKSSLRGSVSFILQAETVEIDGEAHPSRAKLLARWGHTVELGDEIKLFGTIQPIAGPRNPGEFDLRSYLARQDIRRELIVRYPENGAILRHTSGNFILRAARKSRDWMQSVLSRDLEDSPDVTASITGMMLGIRHQTADDIEEPFQQTGTLHLFAVAGLHVGIMARLLWIIATVIRLPRKWATALIIPSLLFYAAITDLHTSSVRAAVMSGVLLGGFLVERKAFAINTLTAAATLLLASNTNELFSPGFQLSFSVVTAIVLVADPTYRLLCCLLAPDPFLPRKLFDVRRRIAAHVTHWFAGASSVSFAAWLGSLPLMTQYYHLVTPISLLANLVVVPIAFLVLANGLLSLVVAPVLTWLSVIFNNANWLLTKTIIGTVYLFAQIPGGHFYVDSAHWPNGIKLEINVLDLKSGGAVHLRTKQTDWLYDAGSLRSYDRVVQPYLRSRGVNRLAGLILTHGDAGHIGGAIRTLHDFSPNQLVDTATHDRSPGHRKLIADLAATGKTPRLCAAQDQIDLASDVQAKILFPPKGFEARKADDQALVAQITLAGKMRILFLSDSGTPTEEFLLRNYPDLRSDVVIKGQHYSGISCSERFLDTVRPCVIVATSTDFPESERIKDEWAELVRARGIRLFRQDETGAVQIRVFRDRWEANTYLTKEHFRSVSR